MASTYVIVRSVDAATSYHNAGLLHFRTPYGWRPMHSAILPPYQAEIDERLWAILVEDDDNDG